MTRVSLALALALALVVAANATAGHRRATHRVLQPLAQQHAHTHAAASEAGAAVQQHDEDVAAGLALKEADFTNRGAYSYPAADIGAPGGHIPATLDCRIAADVFAYALHKDTGSGLKGWPMVGVGLTTAGHWIVALSGHGTTVYKADNSDPDKLKDAVATRDVKRYGGAAAVMPDVIKRMLSTHSQQQMHAYANSGFTDLSDGRTLGWTKLYLNSVGRAMGVYDGADAEGTTENAPMPFVAAGALQCPHRREDVLPTAPGTGNTHVWARRRYTEGQDQYSWSHQNAATHVYRTQTATEAAGVAQGNPFGKCAGSKIAAYARVAGVTLQCMAERKYESANIRASCLTCQHAIGEMFQANAINARNAFVADKQNAIHDLTQQIGVSEGELLVLDSKAQGLLKQLEEAGAKYKRLSRAAESSGAEIKLKDAELKTVAHEYYVLKRLESELQKGVRVCARHRAELRQWVSKDSPQSNFMSIGMGVAFRKSGRNRDTADELTLDGDIAPALLKAQLREKELVQEISDLREIADDHQVIMKINQEMVNTKLDLDKQQLLASKLKHQIAAAKDLRTRLQHELSTFGRFD